MSRWAREWAQWACSRVLMLTKIRTSRAHACSCSLKIVYSRAHTSSCSWIFETADNVLMSTWAGPHGYLERELMGSWAREHMLIAHFFVLTFVLSNVNRGELSLLPFLFGWLTYISQFRPQPRPHPLQPESKIRDFLCSQIFVKSPLNWSNLT